MMRFAAFCVILIAISGCTRHSPDSEHDEDDHAPPAGTGRLSVSAAVRQNLGITFARVERRAVSRTIRVPGRFELAPGGRREYHAPLGGRVELLVEQFQRVERGEPLMRLDSPAWRELQRAIAETEGQVRRAEAEHAGTAPLLAAHAEHRRSLEATVSLWSQRVAQLEEIREAGGGRASDWAQAQAAMTEASADLADVAEQTAELEARRAQIAADLESSRRRLLLLLETAATVLDVPREALEEERNGAPLWQTTGMVEVKAVAPGVVEALSVASGAWVEETTSVLSTVQPGMVRFRARGLQSDLLRLRDGLPARIVPPQGGSLSPAETMEASLLIDLVADPEERTVDLLATPESAAAWARAGVSGFLEVETEGSGAEELAIPLAAVVRDGLTSVIFRRDPKDRDAVIRIEADLGIDDGRWVVVKSGLREGDEVVLDGVYQLMLASSSAAQRGGHFHADGTFHAGEDK